MYKPHVYTPHWSYETVSLTQCRHAVSEKGRGVGFYQCPRKPTSDWTDPETNTIYKFCKPHHPDVVAAKRARDQAKWDKEVAGRELVHHRADLVTQITMSLTVEQLEALIKVHGDVERMLKTIADLKAELNAVS